MMRGGDDPHYNIKVCDNSEPREIYNNIVSNITKGALQKFLNKSDQVEKINKMISFWDSVYYSKYKSNSKGRYFVKIKDNDIYIEVIFSTDEHFEKLVADTNVFAYTSIHPNYGHPAFPHNQGAMHVKSTTLSTESKINGDCVIGVEWKLCASYDCTNDNFNKDHVAYSIEYETKPYNCNIDENSETYIFFDYFINRVSQFIKKQYDGTHSRYLELQKESKLFLLNRISDVCHDLKIDHIKIRKGVRDNIGRKRHDNYKRYTNDNEYSNRPKYYDDNHWSKKIIYEGKLQKSIENSDDWGEERRKVIYGRILKKQGNKTAKQNVLNSKETKLDNNEAFITPSNSPSQTHKKINSLSPTSNTKSGEKQDINSPLKSEENLMGTQNVNPKKDKGKRNRKKKGHANPGAHPLKVTEEQQKKDMDVKESLKK